MSKDTFKLKHNVIIDKTPNEQPSQSAEQEIKTFREKMVLKFERTFKDSQIYNEKMKELKEKLQEIDLSDEEGRAQIEEEIEMRRSKEKRCLLVTLKFVGQFYRHLLPETIVDFCLIELIKRFEATNDEVYIEYAVELVETVGKLYEQCKQASLRAYAARQKTAAHFLSGDEQKPEYRLDMVFSHLIQLKPSVSNRVRFAIMNLEELRRAGWVPRGKQENELERMEREKQKEKDKLQPLRKSSGRASKAERRIARMSRLSDLDNMPLERKPWQSDRYRAPQKETSGNGTTQSGGAGDAWRSNKSGTDPPKEE